MEGFGRGCEGGEMGREIGPVYGGIGLNVRRRLITDWCGVPPCNDPPTLAHVNPPTLAHVSMSSFSAHACGLTPSLPAHCLCVL